MYAPRVFASGVVGENTAAELPVKFAGGGECEGEYELDKWCGGCQQIVVRNQVEAK